MPEFINKRVGSFFGIIEESAIDPPPVEGEGNRLEGEVLRVAIDYTKSREFLLSIAVDKVTITVWADKMPFCYIGIFISGDKLALSTDKYCFIGRIFGDAR